MKLGAQFYSIRSACTNVENLYESFRKIKEIGYEVVQISGVCEIEAERLKAYSDEFSLPITVTHKSFDAITGDTDNLIKYHKIINCPVIGLGGMPKQFRDSLEGAREFMKAMKTPVKKIIDAGLNFEYHNHAFEFIKMNGTTIYNLLIEEAPDFHFVHDVCWSAYAGENPGKYIKLFGESGRMSNIHFKDIKSIPEGEKDLISLPEGDLCPCGQGVIDFAYLTNLCKQYGIKNALVEQDNAPALGDVFAQMKCSFDNLKPLI